jgi:hypothetical protein
MRRVCTFPMSESTREVECVFADPALRLSGALPLVKSKTGKPMTVGAARYIVVARLLKKMADIFDGDFNELEYQVVPEGWS